MNIVYFFGREQSEREWQEIVKQHLAVRQRLENGLERKACDIVRARKTQVSESSIMQPEDMLLAILQHDQRAVRALIALDVDVALLIENTNSRLKQTFLRRVTATDWGYQILAWIFRTSNQVTFTQHITDIYKAGITEADQRGNAIVTGGDLLVAMYRLEMMRDVLQPLGKSVDDLKQAIREQYS